MGHQVWRLSFTLKESNKDSLEVFSLFQTGHFAPRTIKSLQLVRITPNGKCKTRYLPQAFSLVLDESVNVGL